MAQVVEKDVVGEKTKESPDLGRTQSPESDLESTGVNEKSLLRKLDWKLLPAVSVLYLLSFLDRSNVANARIEGLTAGMIIIPSNYLELKSEIRSSHDWKPIPNRPHPLFHWLCYL